MRAAGAPKEYLTARQPLVNLIDALSKRNDYRQIVIQKGATVISLQKGGAATLIRLGTSSPTHEHDSRSRPSPWIVSSSSPALSPPSSAVALGAFGAHSPQSSSLSPDMLNIFEIGVRYHMYHALAFDRRRLGDHALAGKQPEHRRLGFHRRHRHLLRQSLSPEHHRTCAGSAPSRRSAAWPFLSVGLLLIWSAGDSKKLFKIASRSNRSRSQSSIGLLPILPLFHYSIIPTCSSPVDSPSTFTYLCIHDHRRS